LLTEGRSGGDFIRIVMEAIAEHQRVQRWAVYDPDNVLHVDQIRRELPGSLFVHIIRDGRDIALSLMKMEGYRPFPWSRRSRGLLETALYWQWMVCHGQQSGSRIPNDYLEIHYEELVTQPRTVLARLGQFLEHDLDYDRIQSAGLGRLRDSNSSFLGDADSTQNPVNRWKEKLSPRQIVLLEATIGPTLEEFGYALTVNPEQRRISFSTKCLAALYPSFLSGKQWLKVNTPVGRVSNLSALELQTSAADAG
jgi:Sulfotransferase family